MTVLVVCHHYGHSGPRWSANRMMRGWISIFWMDYTSRLEPWHALVLEVDDKGWMPYPPQDTWQKGDPLDPHIGEAA